MSGGATLSVGQLLGGTYRLERELGQGGMGVVYEASHLRLSRRFAIKVLRPALLSEPDLLRRFRREAEITSQLGHPHIVEVIDFDHPSGAPPYIVMELLEGEDLAERVRREGPMPLLQCATIARQTCSALHAAHDRGVVHRDLKPRNIFLARRGAYADYVKVLDFGISKVLGAQVELTVEQLVIGTPGYMAPEQATGRSAGVDRRTDVFAMGAILYHVLTGRAPFSADSQPATLYRIVHEEPESLAGLRPDLPHDLVLVVERALRKERDERYPSMRELWAEMARAAATALEEGEWDIPTEDRPALPPGEHDVASWTGRPDTLLDPTLIPAPTRRMAQRPRRWWLLAAPLLLLAAGIGALIWWTAPGERPSPAATGPTSRPAVVRRGPTTRPALAVVPPDGGERSDSGATPVTSVMHRRPRPRGQRRARLASLHIVTSADERPIWAEILVDGRSVGKSPVSIPRLHPGSHRVVARREGYHVESRRVRLRRGQRRVLMVKLRRATGDR